MGYSYTRSGRLCCDNCGQEGAHKRKCPHHVYYADGSSLPYCPAPALCSLCYTEHGKNLHNQCEESARRLTKEEACILVQLKAGRYKVTAAWGSWHETVPTDFVGVRFEDINGASEYRLIPDADYGARWLDEYVNAQPWKPHA